jgi:hypothetical protein
MDDRELKRAGLDYHEYARVAVHRNWTHAGRLWIRRSRRFFALTTAGTRSLYDAQFTSGMFLSSAARPPGCRTRSSPSLRRRHGYASRCGPACAASTCPMLSP